MSESPETPATADTAPGTAPSRTRSRRSRATGDRAMRRATLAALAVGLVLDVVVIALALLRSDASAVNGALIGTALTLVVVLPTVGIAWYATKLTPTTMAVAVLGSWAGKMLVVIIVLALVRDLGNVSPPWIGIALLVGALSAVIVEAVLLLRSRHPLQVGPAPGQADEGTPGPADR